MVSRGLLPNNGFQRKNRIDKLGQAVAGTSARSHVVSGSRETILGEIVVLVSGLFTDRHIQVLVHRRSLAHIATAVVVQDLG